MKVFINTTILCVLYLAAMSQEQDTLFFGKEKIKKCNVKLIKIYKFESFNIIADSSILTEIHEYNKDGQILKIYSVSENDTTNYILNKSLIYDKGKLAVVDLFNEKSFKVQSKTYKNGMLTSESNYFENNKSNRIDYVYNSKNCLIKMNCRDENGKNYIHNLTYECDKCNRQTAIYIDNVLSESFEYKLDSLTNISMVYHYFYNEGQKTDEVVSYFQFNGKMVQQYQKNYQDNWNSFFVYYYDEKQRLEKEVNTTDNTLKQYYYDDNDLLKEFRFFENQKTLRSGNVYKYITY